ncbi:hypothetical protein LSCM4_02135 [Leishmania orientalis]|uniref:Uncharacterized protein n=1 Tax=Leishmania orientalis TaxID=2249476 RepID=A0A836G0J6_9TRYP|nr:hypothetical protein LSCM4_02135 [Leishmania orientalis]
MRVFVLLAARSGEGCVTTQPPSVWHFQQCLRAHSPLCYHATAGGYLWTRDALFSSLHRTNVNEASETYLKDASADPKVAVAVPPRFSFFSTLLDVGDNEADADVVAMLLMELCVAWPGIIAAHMEVCRAGSGELPPAHTSSPPTSPPPAPAATPREGEAAESSWQPKLFTREETLLVLLADEVEARAAAQDAFLTRWGVHDAWDYTRALQGRSWWVNGGIVAVLPSEASKRIVEHFLMLELSRMGSAFCPLHWDSQGCSDWSPTLEEALAHALLERELTLSLRAHFCNEVEHRIESRALHRMTVAVPPAMALFLKEVPSSLLHECLLYHAVDCPLHAVKNDCGSATLSSSERAICVVAPATSSNALTLSRRPRLSSAGLQERESRVADEETSRLVELFREYDLLLSGDGYVRVPLAPVSRYVFAQLLCQSELPSALMLPFMRQHAGLARAAVDAPECIGAVPLPRRRTRVTEEEVVLGMKVTWAVERWAAALRRGSAAAFAVSLPTWNEERHLHSGRLSCRIQGSIRDAKREAAELYAAKGAADERVGDGGEACTASAGCALPVAHDNTANPLQRCRGAALAQLEEKLFLPFPSSYRGSSTEWVGQAFRDAAREQTLAASNMSLRDDVRAPWTGSVTAQHRASLSNVVCSSSSESDSDATSEDDADDAGGVGAPTASETESLLLQLAELEVVLKRELASHGAGNAVADDEERDVAPWLNAADIQQVTRNELFLQHVQLLESEMEKDR